MGRNRRSVVWDIIAFDCLSKAINEYYKISYSKIAKTEGLDASQTHNLRASVLSVINELSININVSFKNADVEDFYLSELAKLDKDEYETWGDYFKGVLLKQCETNAKQIERDERRKIYKE